MLDPRREPAGGEEDVRKAGAGAAQPSTSRLRPLAVTAARAALLADAVTRPVRRAVATNLSYESACIDSVFDFASKHLSFMRGAVEAARDALDLDHVVVSPASHMGRPRRLHSLALTLPLALAAALPGMALGWVSLLALRNHWVNFDSEGKFRKKLHDYSLRVTGNDRLYPQGSTPQETPMVREWIRRRAAEREQMVELGRPGAERTLTLGPPSGKVKHVVVIMQENHTYDDYFGKLEAGDGDRTLPTATDPPTYTYPWLPTHGNWSWRKSEWMRVREGHGESQIPVYYRWARQYGLLDDFHCFSRGPSTANHIAHFSGWSHNLLNNPYHGVVGWIVNNPESPPFEMDTLPHHLEEAGITWANYGSGAFAYVKDLQESPNNLLAEQFEIDARAGRLRDVSFLVPPKFDLNEHSPDSVWDGMKWVADQVQAVVDGGHWDDTAIIITWDDYGGYPDHVEPPTQEHWVHDPSRPFTLGARVPALVLSPYVKEGLIFREDRKSSPDHPRSFLSIPRFIEDVFGLGPIRWDDSRGAGFQRDDDIADNLMGAFDFNQSPLPPPDCSVPERPKPQSFLRRYGVAWKAAGQVQSIGELRQRGLAGLGIE